MHQKKIISLTALIMAVSFWGCSSNFDDQSTQTSGDAADGVSASFIGAANCIGCHSDFSWSADAVTNYLASEHVIHDLDINAASGACLDCHDPSGDGPSLEQFIDAANIPLDGLAAVACETCHGGGGDHASGVLPVPYVTPDYTRCGQCHNGDANIDHHTYHPEADSIVEKVTASPHVTGIQKVEARCAKCHSDEGAKLYKNVIGTPSELETLIPDATAPLTEASPVQCRTCHNAHSLNLLLAANENLAGSAEYNTCTNCHQPAEAYHGETSASGLSLYRVIYDTHFDQPNTVDASGDNLVEGYNLGPIDANGDFSVASERVCRDCHDVHAADTTINNQWANSAHGGRIAQIKDAAVAAGTANDALTAALDITSPWVHYDWDHTYKDDSDADGVANHDRADCQRCHTATGARNYLDAMTTINDTDPDNDVTYDPDNNDFSHLSGWQFNDPALGGETTPSTQNEMLYCWGCHANNSGDLRNPGGVILEYNYSSVAVVLPDLGKSNVCNTCHGGRGNMESYGLTGVAATPMTTAPGFGGPTVQNVTATHYLAAAANIYHVQTHVGYEYQGLDYTDVSYYKHSRIGTNVSADDDAADFAGAIAIAGTDAGPCAACHMEATNHTLDVVDKDAAGVITTLNATICITCHAGEHGPGFAAVDTTTDFGLQTAAAAVAFLEEEAAGFHEALSILEAEMLARKGITYTGSYPFYSVATNWVDEGSFGAAHNFLYLHHEPGAYAHNRFYAKRLIFDSLDWLDNDVLDGTITIDAVTYPAADAWLESGAARP